jgi:alpha/beta hydrolase family protein
MSTVGSVIPHTSIRRVEADGVTVFYREAGPADAPVVLLLHGFPTSSFQYRDLIPRLPDRYRVIAPDNPNATVQFLDTGHFALETHVEEIAIAMRDFLQKLPPNTKSKEFLFFRFGTNSIPCAIND